MPKLFLLNTKKKILSSLSTSIPYIRNFAYRSQIRMTIQCYKMGGIKVLQIYVLQFSF